MEGCVKKLLCLVGFVVLVSTIGGVESAGEFGKSTTPDNVLGQFHKLGKA